MAVFGPGATSPPHNLSLDTLKTMNTFLQTPHFIKKVRGQVCDGDVDVVDKCDEGDGDGRMMR